MSNVASTVPMEEAVNFANPPVVEVVCGAAFTTLRALRVPHFGLFWNTFRNEFPRVQEAPPLVLAAADKIEIELLQNPPLPRVWFLNEDESALIQIQKDRFIYNWKRQGATDPYPRYKTIYPTFVSWISRFSKFLKENDLGEMEFRQFELTYVNHIPIDSVSGILARAPDTLIDHKRDSTSGRFLPEGTNFSWTTEYALPNGTGSFYILAQSARTVRDGQLLIRLDISAKGIGKEASLAGMKSWFDVAHEWIIHGFIDATDKRVQDKVWGRQ